MLGRVLGSDLSRLTCCCAEAPESAQVAQTAQIDNSDRLQASADLQVFVQEPEDEDEDDQESVLYFPVHKTFNHLVDFIYE